MEEQKGPKIDPDGPADPSIAAEAPSEQIMPTATTTTDRTTATTDLPFLVTHWLAHYNHQSEQGNQSFTAGRTPEEQEAVKRIRRAASELSSAFHALGSFGTTSRVSPTKRIRRLW